MKPTAVKMANAATSSAVVTALMKPWRQSAVKTKTPTLREAE
jgi:hypothetical protein